jgi:hypothetical protein
MDTFYADRHLANISEAHVIPLFQGAGITSWTNPAPEEDYEARCRYDVGFYTNREWLVEQKLDWYSLHSPNFCIERPTLEHTASHYWIHIEPQAYILPMPTVKKLYLGHPKKLVGYQNRIEAAIVPKKAFKAQSKPLWAFVKQIANHYQ